MGGEMGERERERERGDGDTVKRRRDLEQKHKCCFEDEPLSLPYRETEP